MLIKIFELWNLFENSAHNSFKLALRDFMSIVNSVSEFKFENKFIHQCGSKINLKYSPVHLDLENDLIQSL